MPERLQVLIVEDRPADAELMAKALEKAGFGVDWQRVDNERDFRLRLTPRLDLILSDYTLPGFGAIPAMRLRAESKLDVPLIIVSGSVGDEKAAECLKLGATDYILKDRMARLGPAVERALEERRVRREKRHAEESLRESEEQMRGVLSTVEDVVFSMSLPDYKVRYMNPATQKVFGRPAADFLADGGLWLDCVHPADRDRMAENQQSAIRWGTAEAEFRVIHPDKSVHNVLSRVWTAYGPDGAAVRLEGIVTDVTEKRRSEEALRQKRDEALLLSQQNEFKSQFLNMVAHDLNNVVTPMGLNLHALRQAARQGQLPEHAHAIERLDAGLQRLLRFLADLLDAARLQSGKLAVRVEPFDLAKLLQQATDAMRPAAEQAQLALDCRAAGEVTVVADPHRIEQVVANLLSNAVKFTPAGGRITVSLEASEASVKIAVSDTGAGLKAEDVQKLFQPFSRIGTQAQGKHTGTGLGLFISRGILESHGGSIRAESPGPGKGATFVASLPRLPGPPVLPPLPPPPPTPQPPPAGKAPGGAG